MGATRWGLARNVPDGDQAAPSASVPQGLTRGALTIYLPLDGEEQVRCVLDFIDGQRLVVTYKGVGVLLGGRALGKVVECSVPSMGGCRPPFGRGYSCRPGVAR